MLRLPGRSGGASKPFAAWTTIFYLLLVFIAPMAFLGQAHAEKEQAPVQDNSGPIIGIDLGTTYSYVTLLDLFQIESLFGTSFR